MKLYEFFFLMGLLLLCGCNDTYSEAGNTMEPTIRKGDTVIVDPKAYSSASTVKRWNIIVYKFSLMNGDESFFSKRVVGLPNEKISFSNNKIFINGKELIIPETVPLQPDVILREDRYISPSNQSMDISDNAFFVLGDNARKSADSRNYGLVNFSDIIGQSVEVIRKDGTRIILK